MTRAPFIVFEGADRSGKTTQTKRFTHYLCSKCIRVADASPWRFPDRTTTIGHTINSYLTNAADLDDRALHLLFSANRWEKAAAIRAALHAGEAVVLDRYAYSGVAYSVAKNLPLHWCRAADVGLPAPDVIVYLDLPTGAAARRADFGAERYENVEMQKAVAAAFRTLMTPRWQIVDADADSDTVFARVCTAVDTALERRPPCDEILTLWDDDDK